MPALQRARRGLRPGRPRARGRARRRHLGRHRPEDLDLVRPPGQVRHPHRPHRPRRTQAAGHLVLHLPDGRARHRDPAHRRHDRRAHVQRGVPRRGPHPGREPGRRGQQRAGSWPRSRWPTSGCRCRAAVPSGAEGPAAGDLLDLVRKKGGLDRPGAAPAAGPAPHRGRGPPAHPAAHGDRRASRASRPAPRRRCARCWPTSTASRSWGWPRTWPGRRAPRPTGARSASPPTSGTTASSSPPPSPSGAARARCSATSSASGCSACPEDATG